MIIFFICIRTKAAVCPKTCHLFLRLSKSKLSCFLSSAIMLEWNSFMQLYLMFQWHLECSFYHSKRCLERSDTYLQCFNGWFFQVTQNHSERAAFARVVSTERSHPPTQEGVGACKWTTWGSGAFCLKDCCLIHLRHARCTALRGNRQEPPLCTPKDITYYEDFFWEGICDMKPVITE